MTRAVHTLTPFSNAHQVKTGEAIEYHTLPKERLLTTRIRHTEPRQSFVESIERVKQGTHFAIKN
jgi:hypothetical protein